MIKAIAGATLLLLVVARLGTAQTAYYQGKTVTIVVGTGAGDLYDLYAAYLHRRNLWYEF